MGESPTLSTTPHPFLCFSSCGGHRGLCGHPPRPIYTAKLFVHKRSNKLRRLYLNYTFERGRGRKGGGGGGVRLWFYSCSDIPRGTKIDHRPTLKSPMACLVTTLTTLYISNHNHLTTFHFRRLASYLQLSDAQFNSSLSDASQDFLPWNKQRSDVTHKNRHD